MAVGSKIKNFKRIFSQDGFSASTDTRISNLENNVYKVTYYEIVSGASGSLTVPSQATINSDEFGLSGNALLSKIDINNKPTYESPTTLGGTTVTASLNVNTGAWAASGAYTDLYVALIYSIDIKAEYYSNLDNFYIIETANLRLRGTQTLQDVTDLGNTTTHPIEADYFITTGGTSSEFVKGDGSLDNNSYLTSVGATSPITSSGGTNPTISTSMNTNKLIGRTSSGVGVMEEITVGAGLTLSGGTLSTSNVGGTVPHTTASGTDTYTATVSGITAYNDGDAYLVRFTNGNTTGCTLNINTLGAATLYRNNDGPLIGGDIQDNAEMLCVYNLASNTFQCIGTSPNSLISYVTNADSVTLTKGMPVYAFSGTGDRLTVKRANNTSDATSAQTIGLVLSSSIAANQKGFIMMQGLLDGLSILPTSTWSDGDPVYLGATAGTLTKTKPYAPNHLVYLGFVTTASNGSAGRLYVRVQNGYELDELHNVQAQSPNNKDTLYFDNLDSQWKTASLTTVLGYTPENVANKSSSYTASSTTTYANTKALVDGLATKQDTLTPSALTKVDDTNVTLTLGGSPSTALLQAVSLTLGWTGTLSDSRIASASTWNAKQNALSGTGIVQSTSGVISYISGLASQFVKADGTLDSNAYLTAITSLMVTTALGYTPVPDTRNLTINGTTYDLSADRTWTITAGSNLEIKDEGSTLTSAATSIDFTGAGVTATAVGSNVTVNISGGSGVSSSVTNLFAYYNFI